MRAERQVEERIALSADRVGHLLEIDQEDITIDGIGEN
jgi:hypothetical protein